LRQLVGDLVQPSTYIEDIIAFHFLVFHGSANDLVAPSMAGMWSTCQHRQHESSAAEQEPISVHILSHPAIGVAVIELLEIAAVFKPESSAVVQRFCKSIPGFLLFPRKCEKLANNKRLTPRIACAPRVQSASNVASSGHKSGHNSADCCSATFTV
jgi:hypothetical protein